MRLILGQGCLRTCCLATTRMYFTIPDDQACLFCLACYMRQSGDSCAFAQHLVCFLTGQQNVMPVSRFPAVRRPQQLHNVALALNTMQKSGLNLQVCLDRVVAWHDLAI